jgi:hypothetical protein
MLPAAASPNARKLSSAGRARINSFMKIQVLKGRSATYGNISFVYNLTPCPLTGIECEHDLKRKKKKNHMARRSFDTSGPLCGTGRATRWLPAQLSKYVHERAARGRSLPVHSSTRIELCI